MGELVGWLAGGAGESGATAGGTPAAGVAGGGGGGGADDGGCLPTCLELTPGNYSPVVGK